MDHIIDVNTGEVKSCGAEARLRSVAIGSCIAVAAYVAEKKIGAMAHVMLPGKAPEKAVDKTKYALDAIEKLLELLDMTPPNIDMVDICLVGAGNVLEKSDDTICQANIDSVTKVIKERRLVVKASVLGGTKRKSVIMDVETGNVWFTEGDGSEELLWKPD